MVELQVAGTDGAADPIFSAALYRVTMRLRHDRALDLSRRTTKHDQTSLPSFETTQLPPTPSHEAHFVNLPLCSSYGLCVRGIVSLRDFLPYGSDRRFGSQVESFPFRLFRISGTINRLMLYCHYRSYSLVNRFL
jgi:hypothetical protein